jgi:glycogen operon protein
MRADGAAGDRIPALTGPRFAVERGRPLPFGATRFPGGVNFSVFSRHGVSVSLELFAPDTGKSALLVPLDPRVNRTGDMWHVLLRDVDPRVRFGWRVAGGRGDPRFERFAPQQTLIDPYALGIAGAETWGRPASRRGLVHEDGVSWGLDQPLNLPLADSIIYELHVRGYTRHPSSRVRHPGTFLGLAEKIPYLKQLGVTAVELLPVTEFDETENIRINPRTGERLLNFWGYSPIGFFAPKASYAAGPGAVAEFKEMVKRFHAAGIEVILDMVLNHTAEGNHLGPTLSFRGLDNPIY